MSTRCSSAPRARWTSRGPALFFKVILPAATPRLLSGARVAIGVGFMVIVGAEMIATVAGLGALIMEARTFYRTDVSHRRHDRARPPRLRVHRRPRLARARAAALASRPRGGATDDAARADASSRSARRDARLPRCLGARRARRAGERAVSAAERRGGRSARQAAARHDRRSRRRQPRPHRRRFRGRRRARHRDRGRGRLVSHLRQPRPAGDRAACGRSRRSPGSRWRSYGSGWARPPRCS